MSNLHTYSTYSLGIPDELYLEPTTPNKSVPSTTYLKYLDYSNMYFNTLTSGTFVPISNEAILVIPEGSDSTNIKIFVDTKKRFIEPTSLLFKPELFIYFNQYMLGYSNNSVVVFTDLNNASVNTDKIEPYKIVPVDNAWGITPIRSNSTTIEYIDITDNLSVVPNHFITPYSPLSGILGYIGLGFKSEYQFSNHFRKTIKYIKDKITNTGIGSKVIINDTDPISSLIVTTLKMKGLLDNSSIKLSNFNLEENLPYPEDVYKLDITDENYTSCTYDGTNYLGYTDFSKELKVNYTSVDISDTITEGYSNSPNFDKFIFDITSPDIVFNNGSDISSKVTKSYSISNNGKYYLGNNSYEFFDTIKNQLSGYFNRVKESLEVILNDTEYDELMVYDTCIITVLAKSDKYYISIYKLFPQYGNSFTRIIRVLDSKPIITASSNILSITSGSITDWYLLIKPSTTSEDYKYLEINFSKNNATSKHLFKNGVYIVSDTSDDRPIHRMIREDMPCLIQNT
jgi:hypothetical protein